MVREETFGPVSPVIRFDTVEEAIRIANSTAYGLSSAVAPTGWTDHAFCRELNVGRSMCAKCRAIGSRLTPFGGIKDSGLGYKEGVQEAMKSFCNTKTYSLPW